MDSCLVVLCTVPDGETGASMAQMLVENSYAACVNVVPGMTSFFAWEGKINRENECLLVIKTTASSYINLEKAIEESHPYDVPEIIALPVTVGSEKYLSWIRKSTVG